MNGNLRTLGLWEIRREKMLTNSQLLRGKQK
jgi:hypothetical protein